MKWMKRRQSFKNYFKLDALKRNDFLLKKKGRSLGRDKMIVSTMFPLPLGEGETFFEVKRIKIPQ
jgi:hypothetical protein